MLRYLLLLPSLAFVATACGSAHASSSAARLYVAPAGNDGGRCTRTSPCATFNRAYRVAAPGDTVVMAGGTYPAQTLAADSSKTDANASVVFVPASGETVNVAGDVVVLGSHVTFRGGRPFDLKLHTAWARAPASHVRFENVDGATFQIFGSSFVTIKGGDWGPGHEPDDMESRISPDGGVLNSYPHDIVIDGALIHDMQSTDLTRFHNGGLEFVAGYRIAIRNSTFRNNVVYDIEVQDFTTPGCCGMKYGNAHDVLLENNRFEHPTLGPPYGAATDNDNQAEVQFDPQHGPWRNWTIRRNLFENGLGLAFDGPATEYANVLVERNIAGRLTDCGGASSGATWRANLLDRKPCSDGDHVAPFGFALSGGRLVPTAGAAKVKRAYALAAKRTTTRGIARALGRGWTAASVARLLRNPAYAGGFYGPAGANPPLVGKAAWKLAQRVAR